MQAQGYHDEQDQNKENTRRTPTRPSRFATSPVKVKRKDGEVHAPRLEADLRLTPKKQKTVPVSPTKSILKNPHAATPRKAGVREVTVTFKDVRKSMSPEMLRHGSPQRVRSQLAMQAPSLDMAQQMPMVAVGISTEAALRPSAPLTSVVKSVQDSGFDLDAYKAQTEKEMRRLIKYGQKWRDTATRQDEENAKLRTLLEETRKENERLRRRIEQTPQPEEAKNTVTNIATTGKDNARCKRDTVQDIELKDARTVQPQTQLRSTTKDAHARMNRNSSLQQKLDELQDLQSSPPNPPNEDPPSPRAQQPRPPSLQQKVDLLKRVPLERERISSHEAPVQRANHRKEVITTSPPDSEDNEVQKMSLPVRTASLSAAEDRKAAARERLRVKREARAVSSQAALNTVMVRGQKKMPESSRLGTDENESQVDWLAIA